MGTDATANRTERIMILLTSRERQALRIVAAHNGTNASDLLRTKTMRKIMTAFEEIEARLEGAGVVA